MKETEYQTLFVLDGYIYPHRYLVAKLLNVTIHWDGTFYVFLTEKKKPHLRKICSSISEPHSGTNDFFAHVFRNRGGRAEHPPCSPELSRAKLWVTASASHQEARPPCLYLSFWHKRQKKRWGIPCSALPSVKSHAKVPGKYLRWKMLFWGEAQQCYVSLIYQPSTVLTSLEGFKAPRH